MYVDSFFTLQPAAMEPESTFPRRGELTDAIVDVELVPESEPGFAAIVSLRGEHDLASEPELARAIGSIDGSVLVDSAISTL
jgi:hypothetical protein